MAVYGTPYSRTVLVRLYGLAVSATQFPGFQVTSRASASVTRGGRHRKLHHIGSCKQVLGVDYKTFEVFGDVMPGKRQLDSLCGRCFGTTTLPDEEEAESFDSSSEAEAAPAAKKTRP